VHGLIALAIALIAVAITAAPGYAASTRAEYVAQVDPICAPTIRGEHKALDAAGRQVKKGRYKAAARSFRRTNRIFSDGVEQVAAVPPPPADQPSISTWIQMLRSQVPLANRAAAALAHGHIGKAMSRLLKASDSTKAYVRDYGFAACWDL
jgi:hypothetical protein